MRIAAVLLLLAAVAAGVALLARLGDDGPRDPAPGPATEEIDEPVPAPRPPQVPGLRSRKPLAREDLGPTRDPTPLAAEFLLACQGADGFFHAERGAREGDREVGPGHDAALTGLSTLVLLDVADPTGDERAAKGVRAALDAVVAGAHPAGWLAPDPSDAEGHALLTWALAAGYAHTARDAWRPFVAPAVARLLAAAHVEGGWRAPSGRPGDDLLLTTWACGALHEAIDLTRTVPDTDALAAAITAAGEWAERLEMHDVERLAPGARCAWALLLRSVERDAEPIRPEQALRPLPSAAAGPDAFSCDHEGILWGTVHRFLGGDKEAWGVWERGAVLPALERQRLEDPGRGSWDPSDDRSRKRGRVFATAVEAMAWLVIRVPYREPRGT